MQQKGILFQHNHPSEAYRTAQSVIQSTGHVPDLADKAFNIFLDTCSEVLPSHRMSPALGLAPNCGNWTSENKIPKTSDRR